MNDSGSCARDSFLQSRNCQTGRVPQQSWGFTPINQLSVLPNIFDQLLNLKKLDLGFNRLPDDEVKSIQYQVDCDFLNIAGQGTSSASNS